MASKIVGVIFLGIIYFLGAREFIASGNSFIGNQAGTMAFFALMYVTVVSAFLFFEPALRSYFERAWGLKLRLGINFAIIPGINSNWMPVWRIEGPSNNLPRRTFQRYVYPLTFSILYIIVGVLISLLIASIIGRM